MKHTVTRFEMNLYDWNFWTADVVAKFADWLKENGIEAEEACTLVLLGTGQY